MSTTTDLTRIEREALDDFLRGTAPVPPPGARDGAAWLRFGLGCMLATGRLLRERSLAVAERFALKPDGSPVTQLEAEVEELVRGHLARFEPAATFIGEESGGELPAAGFAVAVDPVDGTWAFLAETATWASVLTVFRDGLPFAGFVANPVTGEVAHALHDGEARLLRLSAFGEPAASTTLPSRRRDEGKTLVHVHPGRNVRALDDRLHEAWRRGELGVVRATGGSPAWGLVEAARGHHLYLNAWDRSPAEPFDLAAGVLIVRRAGGDVTDAAGTPIDATRHGGPWVAGIDAARRARVTELVRDAWPRDGGA